jgi:hypothetical protein
MDRVDQRDKPARDTGRPRAAIGLQNIAIDGDGQLAERFQVGNRSETAADQALNFRGASINFASTFPPFSRRRAAWQHIVFSRDPPTSFTFHPRRNASIHARRAEYDGFSAAIKHATRSRLRVFPFDFNRSILGRFARHVVTLHWCSD